MTSSRESGAAERSRASMVAVVAEVMTLSSTEVTKGEAWGEMPSAMGYMARVGSSSPSLGGSSWSVEPG